ncbi:MAG: metallophosphoesterase [Paracoccus sp. (in: a-proteobacteria)]|nr:metallophosphoesterase [Paracoccus sp. (in: a-proteobacteria)]
MIGWLRSRIRPPAAQQGFPPLPRPSQPICLIGDIHGRLDLLDQIIGLIAAQPGSETARVVVLGDMIDRGPDSAQVLSHLIGKTRKAPDRWVCLMGNHERMMLDFLADPGKSRQWLRYGATATLHSYGIGIGIDRPLAVAEKLREAMPADHIDWLNGLPLIWTGEQGLAAVHAAADPARRLNKQKATDLLWGHPDFIHRPRRDGCWIGHGHVITAQPFTANGRISVDTGAWRSGILTAAWMDADELRFIQAKGPPRT